MRHRPSRTGRLFARESPLDTARRELTEHRAACDACIAGLDCPTGDDLDRRLTEAASADLPWDDSTTGDAP